MELSEVSEIFEMRCWSRDWRRWAASLDLVAKKQFGENSEPSILKMQFQAYVLIDPVD